MSNGQATFVYLMLALLGVTNLLQNRDISKQRDAIKQMQGMVIKDADLLKATQAQLEK